MLNWLRSLVEGRIILHEILSIVCHQRFLPLELELNPADDKVEAVVCALLPETTVSYTVELGVGNRKESFLKYFLVKPDTFTYLNMQQTGKKKVEKAA